MTSLPSPVLKLSISILEISYSIADALRHSFEFETKEEKERKWIYVLFEIQQFLIHLISRRTANRVDIKTRNDLIEGVAGSVIESTIETLCGHWSSSFQDSIIKEYYENLSISEHEYGSCRGINPNDENANLQDSMFHTFGYNVACHMSEIPNPGTIIDVQKLAGKGLVENQFNDLIDKACDYLS